MKNLNFLVEFDLWEKVYLKTDPDVLARIVIGYVVKGNNIMYICALGEEENYFFANELTSNIDECLNKLKFDDEP